MSALIEDYFFVNQAEIVVEDMSEVALIPAFCITGPSVFKFELAVNLEEEIDETATVMLLINSVVVATAAVNDAETPSNLSLIYRGAIEDVSDVQVIAMNSEDYTIDAKALQVGYKLYGPGYTLLDAPDTSCL